MEENRSSALGPLFQSTYSMTAFILAVYGDYLQLFLPNLYSIFVAIFILYGKK